MDVTPIAGVDELDAHLHQLLQDPNLPLEAKLFDHVQLQLTEGNISPLIPRLLPRLIALLELDNREPTYPANLATRLLGPVTFTEALTLASTPLLINALRSPSPPINLLSLTVIEKAARNPDDAARLATMPELVTELLTTWLLSPHAGVGSMGRRVLGDLLDVDCTLPPPPRRPPVAIITPNTPTTSSAEEVRAALVRRRVPGEGRLWNLLFRTREPYQLLLDICSGRHPATAGTQGERQLSLAQGRLLDIVPRLAVLDLDTASSSDFVAARPVHATNGGGGGDDFEGGSAGTGEGLLQFAALRMVDTRDVLMHRNLVGFFEGLVMLTAAFAAAGTGGPPSSSTERHAEILRAVLREATARDAELRRALLELPDRMAGDEDAEELRKWLRIVLPEEAVRVDGHWR